MLRTGLCSLVVLASSIAHAGDVPRGKLPRQVVPTAYAVDLRMDARADRYSGAVAIDLEVKEATDHFFIHARGSTLKDVQLIRARMAPLAATTEWVDAAGGTVRVTSPRSMEPGRWQLRLAFDLAGARAAAVDAQAQAAGDLEVEDGHDAFEAGQHERMGPRRVAGRETGAVGQAVGQQGQVMQRAPGQGLGHGQNQVVVEGERGHAPDCGPPASAEAGRNEFRYGAGMDNMDLQVLRQVQQWLDADQRVVLGTITRTWGSAPRPVGSIVAVRADGLIAGSVSGGCIEDDLVAKIREGALSLRTPELIRYGVGAEAAQRFGLPCGGTLELMLEPVGAQSAIGPLLERLSRGERVLRTLELATGAVTLEEPPAAHSRDGADRLVLSETRLVTHHGPQWRLLIIGAGQMSQYLAQMALALDYQVQVCDPRDDYPWTLIAAPLTRDMPDDVGGDFGHDVGTQSLRPVQWMSHWCDARRSDGL